MAKEGIIGGLTTRQKVALASYVASAAVVIVTYIFREGGVKKVDWLYVALTLGVTVVFSFDRLLAFHNDNEIKRNLEMLTPQNIYMECLGRAEAAIDWFEHNTNHVRHVQNTVYRPPGIGGMEKFLIAAREVLKGDCAWLDVCFSGQEEKIKDFRKTLSPQNRAKHHAKTLPSVMPLIQVMILRYGVNAKRPDTVLFGWPSPYSGPESLVFKSDNVEVVNYFDKYFIHLFDDLARPIPNLDPPMPPSFFSGLRRGGGAPKQS